MKADELIKDDLFVRFEQGFTGRAYLRFSLKELAMSIESQAIESPTDATATDLPMKSKKAKKAAITSGLRLKDKLTQDTRRRIEILHEQRQLSNRFGVDIEID